MLRCPNGHDVGLGPGGFCPTCGTRLVEGPDGDTPWAGEPTVMSTPPVAEPTVAMAVPVPPAPVLVAGPPVVAGPLGGPGGGGGPGIPPGPPGEPGGGPPPWVVPAIVGVGLLVLLIVLALVLVNRGKSTKLQTVATTSTAVPTTQATTTSSTRPVTSTTRPLTTTTVSASTTVAPGGQIVTLSQAESVVQSQGYTPANSDGFTNDNRLKVILGTATGSADGYQQRAFFFADGRYLGNDSKDPSAGVTLSDQTNDTVTLQYAIYAPGDPLASPSQPSQTARFRYDGSRLTTLVPVPSHRNP